MFKYIFLGTFLLGGITIFLFSMPHTFVGTSLPDRSGLYEAKAYFAGGCFWCTEADFQKVLGVSEVISGYAGGHVERPTYEAVNTETTGHRESVEVHYNPQVVSYRQLVEYFFDHIDPTDSEGQFHDRGESYTGAIFYQNDKEKQIAEAVVAWLTEHTVYTRPIVTALLPFKNFYPAEEYHQNYSERNPIRYGYYRAASGRNELTQKTCQIKLQKKLSCFTGKLKEEN